MPTQADDPLPVLLSLKAMVQQASHDRRGRQRAIVAERDARVVETARSFDPLRRRLFRVLLGWAQRFGPYREQALFYIGAGWPTLRQLAFELGRRLVESGSLLEAEDIFLLETPELREAIAARTADQARPDLARLARERRDLREARKRLHPPPAVPPDYKIRIGPIDMSAWETQRRNEPTATVLHGFAVSPGRVTAPASVIHSPADFSKMEPGTILVCPTTTPAWTPLFSQARGLVTDVGGVFPRIDRRTRVRHPGCARYRRGNPPHPIRPKDSHRRRRRHGHASGRNGRHHRTSLAGARVRDGYFLERQDGPSPRPGLRGGNRGGCPVEEQEAKLICRRGQVGQRKAKHGQHREDVLCNGAGRRFI